MSAGGVVLGAEGVLLVKVKNLKGAIVWTFPKGHLEKEETSQQAALREVKEETGWECEIICVFGHAHYQFKREGWLVDKTVHWFRMRPLLKTGESDPREIIDCCWFSLEEAKDLCVYPSDLDIIRKCEIRSPE